MPTCDKCCNEEIDECWCEVPTENLPRLNEDVYGIILKFIVQHKRDELNSLLEKIEEMCAPDVYGSVEVESDTLPSCDKSNEQRLIFHSTTPLLQDVTLTFDNLGFAKTLCWVTTAERELLENVGKIKM